MIGSEMPSMEMYSQLIPSTLYETSAINLNAYITHDSFSDYTRIQQIINSTGAEITPTIIKIIFNCELFNFKTINLPNYKLSELRDRIGLNITELANILGVKRPTIYEWLHPDGNPSKKNKNRLEKIYNLLNPLIINNASEFKNYLYNELENGNILYNFLIKNDLDNARISILVQDILNDILVKRNLNMNHENELQNKGFMPVSKKQKDKIFNRLIRKIG